MADANEPTVDDELETLLVQCIEAGERDGAAAVEKILADHPDRAPALRQLLGSLSGIGLLEGDSGEVPVVDRIGSYRLLRRLGEGSMGVVYLARHEPTQRLVAFKTIKQLQAGAAARDRFEREAKVIARLRHPNIVTVFDAGESDGVLFLVMELVGGQPLDERIQEHADRGAHLPVDQVIGWGRDLAAALQCAHDAGVVHRDVKPSNVRIADDGRPVLLDFGLARDEASGTLTLHGSFQGSPNFASPEQVDGRREIGPPSDVFSLGVTLHCCLSGELPFDGATREQVFQRILTEEPRSLRRANARVTRELETVVRKAMEKRPEDRYATAAALADDLGAILEHRPVAARAPGAVRRLAKWARRKPGAATAVVSLVLLVVGLAIALVVSLDLLGDSRVANAERGRALEELKAEQEARETTLAVLTLRDLPRERPFLWPATMERVAGPRGMDRWLSRARALQDRLPEFRERFERLSEEAARIDPGGAKARAALVARIRRVEKAMADRAARGAFRQRQLWDQVAIDSLERQRLRKPPPFDDPAATLEYLELLELVEGIPDLAGEIERVAARRRFALEVEERTLVEPAGKWRATIAAIAADRRYGGLQLAPQLGLIPLGQDPDTGFFEFGHLQTGRVAERDAEGRLQVDGETGLVFVLLPPGTFTMGAQRPDGDRGEGEPNVDPHSAAAEAPVHDLPLAAFFLSKYEMTQGQWQRLTGANPSGYPAGTKIGSRSITAAHPVEQVSYIDSVRWLSRIGCVVPTEAQWEYAARGGTDSIWWTGNDPRDLADAANVADQHPRVSGEAEVSWQLEDWDDGFTYHAPVGSFRANPFGLHDVCGNVAEWCRDWFGSYAVPARTGDGFRSKRRQDFVVARSGSFADPAVAQRSARRARFMVDFTYIGLGLRPSKKIR